MIKQIQAITLDIAGEAVKQDLYGASLSQTADGGFGSWLGNILAVIMTVGAIACFGFILFGAIEWITSAGDKSKLENARNKITNAVIGLIILAASLAIFNLIAKFLGIESVNFT